MQQYVGMVDQLEIVAKSLLLSLSACSLTFDRQMTERVGAQHPHSIPGWFNVSHSNLRHEEIKEIAKAHNATPYSILTAFNTS